MHFGLFLLSVSVSFWDPIIFSAARNLLRISLRNNIALNIIIIKLSDFCWKKTPVGNKKRDFFTLQQQVNEHTCSCYSYTLKSCWTLSCAPTYYSFFIHCFVSPANFVIYYYNLLKNATSSQTRDQSSNIISYAVWRERKTQFFTDGV